MSSGNWPLLVILITLFLGASEPMMTSEQPTQAQMKSAMKAEYDNAAGVMADRERLTEARRRRFAINSSVRVQTMMVENGGNMSRATAQEARRILWALDDLIAGEKYSEGAA